MDMFVYIYTYMYIYTHICIHKCIYTGDLKTVEVFKPVPLKDPKKEKRNGKNEKNEKKGLDGNEKNEKMIKTEKKIDVEKNKNSVVLINLVSLEEAKEPTLKVRDITLAFFFAIHISYIYIYIYI
jgi:hypothetical protein